MTCHPPPNPEFVSAIKCIQLNPPRYTSRIVFIHNHMMWNIAIERQTTPLRLVTSSLVARRHRHSIPDDSLRNTFYHPFFPILVCFHGFLNPGSNWVGHDVGVCRRGEGAAMDWTMILRFTIMFVPITITGYYRRHPLPSCNHGDGQTNWIKFIPSSVRRKSSFTADTAGIRHEQ